MEPTPLGRIFLARAEEVIRAVSDLKREIDLARGLETGDLHIGSGVGPAELHLGTALGRLCQRYPQLKVNIEVDDYAALTQLLQAGEVELFVAETSEVEMAPDFLVTPLRVLKIHLCCRGGHPLLGRLPHLSLQEVLQYPLVMTRLPRRALDSIAQACGFKNHPDWLEQLPLIKCDYVKVAKETVAASDAVAFTVLPMVARELERGEFVILPVDFPELKTHYGIVRLKNRTPSPAAEVFMTILEEVDQAVAATDRALQAAFAPWGR